MAGTQINPKQVCCCCRHRRRTGFDLINVRVEDLRLVWVADLFVICSYYGNSTSLYQWSAAADAADAAADAADAVVEADVASVNFKTNQIFFYW